MNAITKNKNYFLKSYIKLLIIFNFFNYAYSLLLNKIIRFGDKNFRYCHFSFNSNGDMIVDVTSNPASSSRQFFGIKQNGPFFLMMREMKKVLFIQWKLTQVVELKENLLLLN